MKVKGSNNQIITAGRDVNYVSLSKAEIKAIAKAVCQELKKYPPQFAALKSAFEMRMPDIK